MRTVNEDLYKGASDFVAEAQNYRKSKENAEAQPDAGKPPAPIGMSATEVQMRAEDERRRQAQPRSEADERVESITRKLIGPRARQLAKEAGIIDLDDVRFLDLSLIDVTDERVSGLTHAIADLQARKPHYFRAAGSRERTAPRIGRPRNSDIGPGDDEFNNRATSDWGRKSNADFSNDMRRQFGINI